MKLTPCSRLLIGIVAVIGVCSAFAFVDYPFSGWHDLEGHSEIIVARCLQTPDPFHSTNAPGIFIDNPLISSDMEVVSTIKGGMRIGKVTLTSEYWPRQGDYYLIFGFWAGGSFNAYSSYRVVPLGGAFNTNRISGDTVDERVRSLLKYRLSNLNEELSQGAKEKKRLEEGLTQTNASPAH